MGASLPPMQTEPARLFGTQGTCVCVVSISRLDGVDARHAVVSRVDGVELRDDLLCPPRDVGQQPHRGPVVVRGELVEVVAVVEGVVLDVCDQRLRVERVAANSSTGVGWMLPRRASSVWLSP